MGTAGRTNTMDKIEKLYAKNFQDNGMGPPAKSARAAFAALIIQERQKLTDEETVAQIQENPYLQYFMGYKKYEIEQPFDSSLLVHFRKRINSEIITKLNEEMIALQSKQKQKNKKKKDDEDKTDGTGNSGKLIMDSTCIPNDIRYPTDLSLLNEAREKSEEIIDVLHLPHRGEKPKVRTYRMKARQDYLKAAKRRKLKKSEIRKAIGKQLRYIKRNLAHIEKMKETGYLGLLSKRQYKNLLVVNEVSRQQELMYSQKINRISGRIVSISQPHVRPIVRGKAGKPVEFGSKISLSIVDGYTYLDRLSWDPYNESEDLIKQVEKYKTRYGVYPESVHADKIYLTRENRSFCKDLEIRLSGKPLGRTRKLLSKEEIKQKKKQSREDFIYRIAVEGKICQSKRRFKLNRIMTKLAITSETVISMVIFIMNLEKILAGYFFISFFQRILLPFYRLFFKNQCMNPVRVNIAGNFY